jgi:hypothetical protein
VPNPPEVFLGLVTHPESSFNRDARATRLLEQVAQEMEASGISTEYLLSDQNDYRAHTFPINRKNLIAAANAQAKLEYDWRIFINQKSGLKVDRFHEQYLYQGMRLKRTIAALKGEGSAAARAYQRLINIDLSHLRVLTRGIESGAKAVMILEDDASLSDLQKIGDLAQVIKVAIEKKIDFINLSESISAPELEIERIISRGNLVECGSNLQVVELDVPVTNTVCANYYSRGFAIEFQSRITPDSLIPVKPIDWRLNEVMLAKPNTTCWWLQPGIFVQGSMHENSPNAQS